MPYRIFYTPMTDLSFRLLRLLADGEFHSGAKLARELGVSRGTVWNAVRVLEDTSSLNRCRC